MEGEEEGPVARLGGNGGGAPWLLLLLVCCCGGCWCSARGAESEMLCLGDTTAETDEGEGGLSGDEDDDAFVR